MIHVFITCTHFTHAVDLLGSMQDMAQAQELFTVQALEKLGIPGHAFSPQTRQLRVPHTAGCFHTLCIDETPALARAIDAQDRKRLERGRPRAVLECYEDLKASGMGISSGDVLCTCPLNLCVGLLVNRWATP